MEKLILHIPHSSNYIPSYEGYLLDADKIEQEILKLTDWYTDDLFDGTSNIRVIAEFSRVFCDVERFSDDEQEIMARYGMGALYQKTDSGELMREVSTDLRDHIMLNYYCKHHEQLLSAVNQQLLQGKAMIVDCHSYSNIPFLRDLDQNDNRPDFCIGTDQYHTPSYLIDASAEFFRKKGYSVKVDSPYSGTIVPMEYYQSNRNVQSIMLEINRKLYLEGPTNQKNANYPETKRIVTEYLEMIKNKGAD